MVDSEVSGVLFTANPLTGLCSETVIDATPGLGEALVSGQVEPDHYVVDTRNYQILSRALGEKKIATRAKAGCGVEVLEEEAQSRQALTDVQILALAALGQRIQQEYNFPQDIEWALTDDHLHVLQSRPITSLYPSPEESFDPLIVWFSFGAVQGLLGAITPLGQDAIRMAFSGAARLFGARVSYDENRVLVPAGERLWIGISDVMRHPLGARIYQTLLGSPKPSRVWWILNELASEPCLGTGKGQPRLSTVAARARFLLPVFGRVARNLHDPEKARPRFQADLESQLVEPEISGKDKSARLAERLQFMYEQLSHTLYYALPRFLPRLVGLNEETRSDHGFSAVALEVTRGVPDNVTTEMDMALWRCAHNIRQDPDSCAVFLELDAAALASRYLAGALPDAAQAAIAAFMKQYGMRGLAEIDLGQLRCREDPTSIMQTLQSYLAIPPELAPDTQFQQGKKAAEQAIERLAHHARQQPLGVIREKLVRALGKRVRTLMGLRDSPKFFIVRRMGKIREQLLASGAEFAAAGMIERPDDLFFLHFNELQALVHEHARDWKSLIAERRAIHERENRRRQVPRVLLSDGRAFHEGIGVLADTDTVISGSPVSPGVAEGVVRIIFDPRGAQLAPGEILVCPGTDPAWTPLFMAAAGLITEVGG